MSEIFFIARGIRQQLVLFETFLQSQMWPWVRTNSETGKKEVTMFQGALRDNGFCLSYTFPDECLEDVCKMLGIKPENQGDDKVGAVKKWGIRKGLGNKVKPLPKKIKTPDTYPRVCLIIPPQNEGEQTSVQPFRFVEKTGLQIHVLGYKKDEIKDYDFDAEFGKGGKYKQEML